jgi:hypothetical protein
MPSVDSRKERRERDAALATFAALDFGQWQEIANGLEAEQKFELLSLIQSIRDADCAEIVQIYVFCEYNILATRACLGH